MDTVDCRGKQAARLVGCDQSRRRLVSGGDDSANRGSTNSDWLVITELIVVALVLASGILAARCGGFDDWVLPAVGWISGLSLLIIVTSLLVICGLPTDAFVSLGLTALLPSIWWAALHRQGQDVSIPIATWAATAITALLFVVGLHQLHLVKLSPDSYHYLNTAALLASGNIEYAAPNWLQLRLLGVPSIHSAANLSGGYYLRSVTPLLSLSTLMLLGWICMQWCRSTIRNRHIAAALAVLAPLLLASHHQFAYHAFYINGHILVGTYLLILAGGSWLLTSGAKVDVRAIWLLQILCIPPLVVTRPDGALFAALALLPTLVCERFSPRQRGSLLGILGTAMIVWHGFLWMRYSAADQPIAATVTGMFGLGVVSLIAIPVLFWRRAAAHLRHLLPAVQTALWFSLWLSWCAIWNRFARVCVRRFTMSSLTPADGAFP